MKHMFSLFVLALWLSRVLKSLSYFKTYFTFNRINMAQEALLDRIDLHASGEEGDFSGFSDQEITGKKEKKSSDKKRLKSVVVEKENKPPRGKGKKQSGKTLNTISSEISDRNLSSDKFDLKNLSNKDIEGLRTLLGIQPVVQQNPQFLPDCDNYDYNEDNYDYMDDESVNDNYSAVPAALKPNLRVEVAAQDVDIEDTGIRNLSKDFSSAFDDGCTDNRLESDSDTWDLPKLKIPEKGEPVNESLANLINTAFTAQCDLDSILNKYQVPKNCDRAIPPIVNQEIWKTLDKRAHFQDKFMVDIQNLVVSGLGPVVKLLEFVKKNNLMKNEAKCIFSDLFTVLGQVQYNLSLRRRYLIRPYLKKKYSSLCSISMPITTKLFGDDVSKEVKSCDALSYIGKDYTYSNYRGVQRRRSGRGFVNSNFSNYGYQSSTYNQRSGFRTRPYPLRGQSFKIGLGGRGRGMRRGALASATASAPNDQE
ncbi:uncharacterized protein LOC132738302 [Ruditapes philippinarum]|uniref:uncharacterized protein LOC132738302 n=1 Tax=Ruditapes philippinarum TaxID=129788 RepID=UPI00295C0622|nr:uncharacterized protein LOC132738302 [Ruditapes philippinarum]